MKTIEIEWRHLERDGATCDRCADTGRLLPPLVKALDRECRDAGVAARLRETPLGPERIQESNLILIDGRPLESLLPSLRVGMSDCPSCATLTGCDTQCRTLEDGAGSHAVPPAAMIRLAFCRVAGCC